MLDLTGLGISGAKASAVNAAGQVVGFSDEFGLNAFLWADGELTDLSQTRDCCTWARDINGSGLIVGQAGHAVIWQGEDIIDLGTLGGSTSSASAVNDAVQIAGTSSTETSVAHPFRWQDGVMIDLGTLGGSNGQGYDINEIGHVTGYSDDAQNRDTAFVWRDGLMTNLGTLPGGLISYAYALNHDDWIVGSSYGDGFMFTHATLWIDDTPVDLNDIVDESADGWTLVAPRLPSCPPFFYLQIPNDRAHDDVAVNLLDKDKGPACRVDVSHIRSWIILEPQFLNQHLVDEVDCTNAEQSPMTRTRHVDLHIGASSQVGHVATIVEFNVFNLSAPTRPRRGFNCSLQPLSCFNAHAVPPSGSAS